MNNFFVYVCRLLNAFGGKFYDLDNNRFNEEYNTMPGKKTKKVKKATKLKKAATTKSKNATTRNTTTAQQIEKDFLQTPSKITTQLNKEVATLKQQDKKLKAAVDKLTTQAAKAKSTSAKKATEKKLKTATATWQANAKTLAQLTVQQAKTIELRKQLSQFEKNWSKKAKDLLSKAIAKAMPKPKPTPKAKPKKTTAKAATYIKPVTVQPIVESFETSFDDARQEEAVETTS